MKARVKATGEIIEVERIVHTLLDGRKVERFETEDAIYVIDDLDFDVKEKSLPKDEPDYWEKLRYQYVGMAMQGILSNNDLLTALCDGNKEVPISKIVSDNADIIATALVNRLKEESK